MSPSGLDRPIPAASVVEGAGSARVLTLRPHQAQNESSPRRIASHALLDGARELVIVHQGGEYHLRLTRNDKLILTK